MSPKSTEKKLWLLLGGAGKVLQFLTEDFTVLGKTLQNWMPTCRGNFDRNDIKTLGLVT